MSSSNFNNFLNSAIGTGIAEFVTLPICAAKTNYQNSHSNSMIRTINEMYTKGGIKIFYKASYPAILSQMFSTSSKYGIYSYLNDSKFFTDNKILNGIFSGIISSMITHPIDVVKIHMQMSTPFIPELKNYGIRLFYRGYSKTFSKICISSSLFFPLYDYIEEKIDNSVIASLCSATVSTIVMHPIDYLKTRHIYGQPLYSGLNPTPYYKGLTLNLLRVVPHFMIVMCTIDFLKLNRLQF